MAKPITTRSAKGLVGQPVENPKVQEEFVVEQTIPRVNPATGQHEVFWRVYYWATRPDAHLRAEDDKSHWHPDGEFNTEEEARKRVEELKSGAERRSILDMSNMNVTKH